MVDTSGGIGGMMNLYYAITKEISLWADIDLDGFYPRDTGHIGSYFFAGSRGKAKAALIRYAKADGERVDITEIASVSLIARNVDHEAGVCDIDNPLHPDYQRWLEVNGDDTTDDAARYGRKLA